MYRTSGAIRLLCLPLFAAAFVGCSTTTGGSSVTFFPQSHKLLDQTKALKASHSAPVQWPRELHKGVAPTYVLEPGDVVSFQPADPNSESRVTGERPILVDGTIDVETIGRVQIAHMTLADAEAAVNKAAKPPEKDKKPVKISLRLAKAVSKVYYVLGEVGQPGAFPLDGRETVLDAILFGGGLTSKADHDNIILSRPTGVCECRVTIPICYDEIVQWGDTSTNYQLMPGDRIYIPTKSLWSRLFGGRKKICPPCGGCPASCPLPEERCCGPACGAVGGQPVGSPAEGAAPAPAGVGVVPKAPTNGVSALQVVERHGAARPSPLPAMKDQGLAGSLDMSAPLKVPAVSAPTDDAGPVTSPAVAPTPVPSEIARPVAPAPEKPVLRRVPPDFSSSP